MHYRSSKISLSGLTFPIITSSIDFDDFGILMTATFKSLREITLLWSLLIKCIRGLKMIIRLRVFKDLPKEFDTVDHSTLITNLTVVKSKMWYSLSNTKTTCKIIFFFCGNEHLQNKCKNSSNLAPWILRGPKIQKK